MTNTEDNKRNLIRLALTILTGLVVIAILLLYENKSPTTQQVRLADPSGKLAELEEKIKGIRTGNFDPQSFTNIAVEINASENQRLITEQGKIYLDQKLKDTYSGLVFNKCESYLSGGTPSSGQEPKSLLSQLENIIGRNPKIDTYRNQITWYNHYKNQFPAEVRSFIEEGIINYDDEKYNQLLRKATDMPNLAAAYKNSASLRSLRSRLTQDLQNFNAQWATSGQ